MPLKTEWVAPAAFLKHRGVAIYHVHKDDDVEMFRRPSEYGYDEQCSDDGDFTLDVRKLPNPHNHDVNHPHGCRAIVRDAIDAGILTQDGIQGDLACPNLST